jgi:hypothetical protein
MGWDSARRQCAFAMTRFRADGALLGAGLNSGFAKRFAYLRAAPSRIGVRASSSGGAALLRLPPRSSIEVLSERHRPRSLTPKGFVRQRAVQRSVVRMALGLQSALSVRPPESVSISAPASPLSHNPRTDGDRNGPNRNFAHEFRVQMVGADLRLAIDEAALTATAAWERVPVAARGTSGTPTM